MLARGGESSHCLSSTKGLILSKNWGHPEHTIKIPNRAEMIVISEIFIANLNPFSGETTFFLVNAVEAARLINYFGQR